MGYTTDFEGELTFNKPVTEELKEYINKFSDTRRMKRDNEKIKELFPNWKELCFKGNLGVNGEYKMPQTHLMGMYACRSCTCYFWSLEIFFLRLCFRLCFYGTYHACSQKCL